MDNKFKYIAELTIKSAKNLQKLGLSTAPSPYIITQLDEDQQVTNICQSTCNPSWNHKATLTSNSQLSIITVYVFNSNPNDVDELLAVGTIQFGDLLTQVPTLSRVMLRDSVGNSMSSWVEVQHVDGEVKGVKGDRPKLDARATVRFSYLGITASTQREKKWLQSYKNKRLILEYGVQIKQLLSNMSIITLKFDASQPQIKIKLQLCPQITLYGAIQFQNIRKNSSLRIKLYHNSHEVIVLLSASIIQNGLLPENHNTLLFQIESIRLEPLKKIPQNWCVSIHSIFSHQIVRQYKQPCRLYVENGTELQFQFFDQSIQQNTILDYEPVASYVLPVNSINWSNTLNSLQVVKLFNAARGIVIQIAIRVSVLQNEKDSGLIPKFAKPQWNILGLNNVFKVSQIKMSGACLSEILTQKTILQFIFIPNTGIKTIFPPFQLKPSMQYSIPCRLSIPQTPGTLSLITYDHNFGKQTKNQSSSLQDHLIFTIQITKQKPVQDLIGAQIKYGDKFLSFAKKQSLVKLCKKFQIMVKDKTLSVRLVGKTLPNFQPGYFCIRNCMVEGGRVSVGLSMVFDSNQFKVEGQWGDYLMIKPYIIYLKQNGIQIKISQQGKVTQCHLQFEQAFGSPIPQTLYKHTISVQNYKITLIYSYIASQSLPSLQSAPSPPLNKIYRFKDNTQLNMKIKSAYPVVEGYSNFQLRVNKGSTLCDTLYENSIFPIILFRDCEEMYFQGTGDSQYLFFMFNCKDKDGMLVLYAGHYPTKNIVGKGTYQLTLTQISSSQQNQKKLQCPLTFQILTSIPQPNSSFQLHPQCIQIWPYEHIKQILKYYLVAQINNKTVGIYQLNKDNKLNQDNAGKLVFGVAGQGAFGRQDWFNVGNGQRVVWRLYCCSRQLSRDGFWNAEKEFIGSGVLLWPDVQSGKGACLLRFLPSKQMVTRMSANRLSLLQTTTNIQLLYKTQPQNSPSPPRPPIPHPLDIQILHTGACKITLQQILPLNPEYKTLSLKLNPFEFEFCVQSRLSLHKQFIIEAENMKINMVLSVNRKNKDRYKMEKVQKVVNLRGRKIKVGENVGIQMQFQGIAIIKARVVVMSTKFTNNCRGTLKLTKLTSNYKLRQAELYFLAAPNQLKYGLQKLEPSILQLQNQTETPLQLSYQTNTMQSALFFIITLQQSKQKIKTMIQLAQIPMDKLSDQNFKYQWVADTLTGLVDKADKNGRKQLVLGIEGVFVADKMQAVQGVTAGYKVDGEVVEREFNNKEKLAILNRQKQMSNYNPQRKRGYRIIVTVPQSLVPKSVRIILPDNQIVPLEKSEYNSNKYMLTSQKAIKVDRIQIQSQQVERIEELEQKNFTRRFLINRNPTLITTLTQQPYALANIPPQSLTLTFNFHQIYSTPPAPKILCLRSNKHDEILTRQFGLLVKHGHQQQIIRKIRQNGQYIGNVEPIVKFGYDPLVDQLQLYLFIHHAANAQISGDEQADLGLEDWVRLFPVAYGKIGLEKIGDSNFVGCKLQPLDNRNQTLDKALNQIFVHPQSLICLGSVHMYKKKWGFITLELLQIEHLQLDFENESSLVTVQMGVEVDGKKLGDGVITEARKLAQVDILQFSNRSCRFMYIEDTKDCTLKVVGTLLTINSSYKLFEKRIDISEYLSKPGNHTFSSQIKQNESKSIKSIMTMKLGIRNESSYPAQENIVAEANRINKVDLVSFKNYKQNQIIDKMVQCQQPSHLCQMFNQVKESFVYAKQPNIHLFKFCILYLCFWCDSKIVLAVLDIIGIQIYKFKQTVTMLEQQDLTNLYNNLKILFTCKEQPVSSSNTLLKRLSTNSFSQRARTLSDNPTFTELNEMLKIQKTFFYGSEKTGSVSPLVNPMEIMSVLEALVSKSEEFSMQVKKDIIQWDQSAAFKEQPVFDKYITMLSQIYRGKLIPQQVIEDVLVRALKRQSRMQGIVQLWCRLPKQKMSQFTDQLSEKQLKNLTSDPKQAQQFSQTMRLYINTINLHSLQIPNPYWQKLGMSCTEQLINNKDIATISLYGELLLKVMATGKMSQNWKIQVVGMLKKRMAGESNKNVKVCLSNIVDKIVGRKPVTVQQAAKAKTQFYKKYLITN